MSTDENEQAPDTGKPQPKKIGRPTLLTPAVHDAILANIRGGDYIETACLVAGISYQNYYNWQKKGRSGEEPYRSFFEDCARARAEHEHSLVRTAQAGDEKGVSHGPSKAAAWMLERTRPARFAASLKLNLDRELDKILGIAERVLEPAQYAKLVEAISAAASCSEEASGDSGEE